MRGPIKSFRDLDVYTKSTALSAEIFALRAPKNFELDEELKILKDLSKYIPKMIAESYGNRFDNFAVAERKLEKTAEIITAIISKLDFIILVLKGKEKISLAEEIKEFQEKMERLLKDYSTLRAKTLNLKRAWIRINENFNKKT